MRRPELRREAVMHLLYTHSSIKSLLRVSGNWRGQSASLKVVSSGGQAREYTLVLESAWKRAAAWAGWFRLLRELARPSLVFKTSIFEGPKYLGHREVVKDSAHPAAQPQRIRAEGLLLLRTGRRAW